MLEGNQHVECPEPLGEEHVCRGTISRSAELYPVGDLRLTEVAGSSLDAHALLGEDPQDRRGQGVVALDAQAAVTGDELKLL